MNVGFVLLNTFLVLLVCSYGQHDNKLEMGPYISTVTRSEQCQKPPKLYEKEPSALFYSDIYHSGNRTLFRGNLTVLRVNPSMKLQVKGFIMEGDKGKVIYIAKSIGCYGLIINVWKIALNAVEHKGCIPKGSYIFKDLDFDSIQHMWMSTFMYGRFRWRVMVSSQAGTTVCWEFDTVSAPRPLS